MSDRNALVRLGEVLDAISAVRKRHQPPTTFAGAVYSEAQQTCDEVYKAVEALVQKTRTPDQTESGMTIRNLVGVLEKNNVLDMYLYQGGRPVMSVAVLAEMRNGVSIEMNTRATE